MEPGTSPGGPQVVVSMGGVTSSETRHPHSSFQPAQPLSASELGHPPKRRAKRLKVALRTLLAELQVARGAQFVTVCQRIRYKLNKHRMVFYLKDVYRVFFLVQQALLRSNAVVSEISAATELLGFFIESKAQHVASFERQYLLPIVECCLVGFTANQAGNNSSPSCPFVDILNALLEAGLVQGMRRLAPLMMPALTSAHDLSASPVKAQIMRIIDRIVTDTNIVQCIVSVLHHPGVPEKLWGLFALDKLWEDLRYTHSKATGDSSTVWPFHPGTFLHGIQSVFASRDTKTTLSALNILTMHLPAAGCLSRARTFLVIGGAMDFQRV